MKPFYLIFIFSVAFFFSSCAPKSVVTPAAGPLEEPKIAMVLPYRLIGRYAYSTSTSVFTYFLTRNHPFVLKTFQIEDESPEEIERALNEIKEQGFRHVIAPLTPKGARIIAENEEGLQVFFPTIHKNDLDTNAPNIYFGAIDYRAQTEKLMPYASSPLVIMYDESAQGKKLLAMAKESYLQSSGAFRPTGREQVSLEKKIPYEPEREPKERKVIAYGIDKKRSSMRAEFDGNGAIQFGSFFLNTPLVKSAMILSQLSFYDTNVTNVLSTQISYDPLILSMTQEKDREKLYIANSIGVNDDALVETNSLLSNDIVYDWINYASTIGADYFYHSITGEERLYPLPVVDNQVRYPVSVMQPSASHFITAEEGELP